MVEMFPLRSEDAAYSKVRGMLSTLGDPYTRIISPKVSIFKAVHLHQGNLSCMIKKSYTNL